LHPGLVRTAASRSMKAPMEDEVMQRPLPLAA
jgi:hypothetical protein